MAFLVDTSILVRLANTTDAQHPIAARAVLELHRRNELLHLTPQVLIEFRNVATRAKALNGAGLAIVDAEAHATTFETTFPLLPETPDIFAKWKALVGALGVIGKQVHDAPRRGLPCEFHNPFAHVQRNALFTHGHIQSGYCRGRSGICLNEKR